jgi:putative ABC transport system permease protein
MIFPPNQSEYNEDTSLGWMSLGIMSDFFKHINLVEGKFPAATSPSGEEPVDVLMSEKIATEFGLHTNEQLIAYRESKTSSGASMKTQIQLRIAGIWEPANSTDEYWISSPGFYNEVLFVHEDSFAGRISGYLPDEVHTAYWYMVMDGSDVHANDAGRLLWRIGELGKNADTLLPNTWLSVSPADQLAEYQRLTNLLTVFLYAFSIPILGLLLAFIALVSRLSIERKQNEIAILRSRGATSLQIFWIVAMESALLGIFALVISVPVAIQITRIIGQTRSFMVFDLSSDLRVGISSNVLWIGIGAVCLVLVLMFLQALSAVRYTIISYKQESSRVLRPPWWQRAWIDVLLFIPAAYGTYLLKEQGRLAVVGAGGGFDLYHNPLLYLVPSLGILALTLFSLRLVQPLMAALAWLTTHTRSLSLVMAARQLSRSPASFSTPLVILILTVSLSSYTASLSFTLDKHLYDQKYYQTGSDIQFLEYGDITRLSTFAGPGPTGPSSNVVVLNNDTSQTWYFLPVTEYLKLTGIQTVARFGRYKATTYLSTSSPKEAIYIGIDRVDFPRVAYWRDDFASASLGALMNTLALDPAGVLVDRQTLNQYGYKVGDIVRLMVWTSGQINDISLRIAGSVNLFPTWYPEQGPLFVGNLDYLFEQAGGEFPYRVLSRTDSGINYRQLNEEGIKKLNVWIPGVDVTKDEIDEAERQPERQGLFGFLFIGYAAAALVTVLAFLLYVVNSFNRRAIQLGVLRASGLSTGQMTAYVVWELVFLIIFGVLIGTGLGYYASQIFIPFLQIGAQTSDLIPPFTVLIAWPTIIQFYSLFGFLFFLTLIASIYLLRRMKIYQVIKLGETI